MKRNGRPPRSRSSGVEEKKVRRDAVPDDELLRATLHHIRMGIQSQNEAMRCAAALDRRGKARAVWKELLLFSYTHTGLANISAPALIMHEYAQWFSATLENGGAEEGSPHEKTVRLCEKARRVGEAGWTASITEARRRFMTGVCLACITRKNRLSSHCSSAYLLASVGTLAPEEWRYKLCPIFHAVRCVRSIRDGYSSAVKKSCGILGNAVVSHNEQTASRMVDLLCGWGHAFVVWDVLCALCAHVGSMSPYAHHVSVNMVVWLILTQHVDEFTDVFVPELVSGGDAVEEGGHLSFGGGHLIPRHNMGEMGGMGGMGEMGRMGRMGETCKDLISKRMSLDKRPHKEDRNCVRSRPILFHTILLMCRMIVPVDESVNLSVVESHVHDSHGEDDYEALYDDRSPTALQDLVLDGAVDVYTARGRGKRRGAVHLLRQENRLWQSEQIYGTYGESLEDAYAHEEELWEPQGAINASIVERKAEWYGCGVQQTHPEKMCSASLV